MTTWVVEVGDPDQDDVTGGDLFGPFRSRAAAAAFVDKIKARIPEGACLNVCASPIQAPTLRNVRNCPQGYLETDD